MIENFRVILAFKLCVKNLATLSPTQPDLLETQGFFICQIELIFDLVLIFQRFLEHFVLKQKINLEKLSMYSKYLIAWLKKTRKILEHWQCALDKITLKIKPYRVGQPNCPVRFSMNRAF